MLHGYRHSLKTKDTYVDIAKHVKTRFDNLIYELERPIPNGKK